MHARMLQAFKQWSGGERNSGDRKERPFSSSFPLTFNPEFHFPLHFLGTWNCRLNKSQLTEQTLFLHRYTFKLIHNASLSDEFG